MTDLKKRKRKCKALAIMCENLRKRISILLERLFQKYDFIGMLGQRSNHAQVIQGYYINTVHISMLLTYATPKLRKNIVT